MIGKSIMDSDSESGSKKMTTHSTIKDRRLRLYSKEYVRFKNRNNGHLNEKDFYKKVDTAFHAIQNAWSKKDLRGVRHFLSDGMYQKFNVQFKMMNILKQKNSLSHIKIHHIYADSFEADGDYDIIHVGIEASITDYFECGLDNRLNSGGQECFIEYWSFIRKTGKEKYFDLYNSNTCPSCGGNLENKMGEVSACPYCSTLINNAEYDWVLSEITQANDYSSKKRASKKSIATKKLESVFKNNIDSCVQRLEDKAANAYMQILAAKVTNAPEQMRRFVSDSFYTKCKLNTNSVHYVYNRLYFNSVDLISFESFDNHYSLSYAIRKTSQRVSINDNNILTVKDPYMTEESEVITLIRGKNYINKGKGDIYAHTCNNCGGPLADTLEIKCRYCGVIINSIDRDWIVNDIVPYHKFKEKNAVSNPRNSVYINYTSIDKLYSVRDISFNNLLIMMAIDGRCELNEKTAIIQAGRRWGYTKDVIDDLIDSALNKRLSFKMPNDPHMRKKIFILMKNLAKVDGNLSLIEEKFLKKVKEHYKIED